MQLRSVSAKEALRLQQEQGYVILDVRPEAEFEEVVLWEYSSQTSKYEIYQHWLSIDSIA